MHGWAWRILFFFVDLIYEEMKSMEISILTYLIRFLLLFYMWTPKAWIWPHGTISTLGHKVAWLFASIVAKALSARRSSLEDESIYNSGLLWICCSSERLEEIKEGCFLPYSRIHLNSHVFKWIWMQVSLSSTPNISQHMCKLDTRVSKPHEEWLYPKEPSQAKGVPSLPPST